MSSLFPNATLARKPSGHFLVDEVVVADTIQCCHCGTHFAMVKGSGIERGFCGKCMKVVCGKESCMTICTPWQKKIEATEKKVIGY